MTTIPVDLGWLIIAGFILMPAMAYLASYEANRHATRHHRKWMEARVKAVGEREDAVRERETELRWKAHNISVLTQDALRQANSRDTVPTMQEL